MRRFETFFLAIIPSVSWLYGAVTTGIGNFFAVNALRSSILYLIYGTLLLAAWAATTIHVIHPAQLVLSIAQRLVLAVALYTSFVWVWNYNETFNPWILDILFSLILLSSIAVWVDRASRAWLDIHGRRRLAKVRQIVTSIAATESNAQVLTERFSSLLRIRWHTSTALLLTDEGEDSSLEPNVLNKAHIRAVLGDTGWATPESLERRKRTEASDYLYYCLISRQLGVIVASPKGSKTPSLTIALGTKTSLWPFTYLEVRDVQEIAELMGDILTRSRLAAQAALNARVEHLAMMSRGLAHDLKNLITPVSSFLIHTDGHFAPQSVAGEVHSAARRSVKIMGDYVREALFFSEQLTPRFEPVDFVHLFSTVAEITFARASSRRVLVVFSSAPHPRLVADEVLLQRVLANLVSNAIDASQSGQQVTVSATTLSDGKIRLRVEDHGCGIPPENLARIFDPYFTTKEFGDDIRGFGLGLTICQKIVQLHGGVVSVESEVQRGTTVSMVLPHNPGAETESVS